MPRRPNKLLARPGEQARGAWSGGTDRYPGFHTAADQDVTWAYAQRKAVPNRLASDVRNRRDVRDVILHDWPVIIGLDMQGFDPLPDYDAVEVVSQQLVGLIREAIEAAGGRKKGSFAAVRRFVDTWFDPDPDSLTDSDDVPFALERATNLAVYQDVGPALLDALQNIEDAGGDVDAYLLGLDVLHTPLPADLLVAVTGQRRYVADVDEDRIVEVIYMQPFWPNILDFEMSDRDADIADAVVEAGWSAIDRSDLDHPQTTVTSVWRQDLQPGARVEWHGTSLRNLLAAAPFLRGQLPKPPPPFGGRTDSWL